MDKLRTFNVPDSVTRTDADRALGKEMIKAWQADGAFQIATTKEQDAVTRAAYAASKRFFNLPLARKAEQVSDLSYSGYIAPGEEINAEIFLATKDVQPMDARVRENWPCHGPVPWPDKKYAQAMQTYMVDLGAVGDKLLRLTALGLGLPDIDSFTKLTDDGWHHNYALRFPAETIANAGYGSSANTDYGLLTIVTASVGGLGLWIRPPAKGERRNRNWSRQENATGADENDADWMYVAPVPGVMTVFPGDTMQFMTGDTLLATPHKVRLAQHEQHAMAYFHDPAFQAVARPLDDPTSHEYIHYGTHFTNIFMGRDPEHVTTRRIHDEDRLAVLGRLREKSLTT